MRMLLLTSKAGAAILVIGCLFSMSMSAQQSTATPEQTRASQADSQRKDGGGGHQAGDRQSGDQATEGRVNVTVRPQNEEKGDAGSPTPKGCGWIPWFFSVLFS